MKFLLWNLLSQDTPKILKLTNDYSSFLHSLEPENRNFVPFSRNRVRHRRQWKSPPNFVERRKPLLLLNTCGMTYATGLLIPLSDFTVGNRCAVFFFSFMTTVSGSNRLHSFSLIKLALPSNAFKFPSNFNSVKAAPQDVVCLQ